MEDPWENIKDTYPINSVNKGKVTSITDYGFFAELDSNNRGIWYYTRPMIGQKGDAVKTNYFIHQNKDTARNNVLNYTL